MPLKHTTETFFVFLLGVVILLTGILLPTLPDLPRGAIPWTGLFIFSLLYPLVLFFLFRSRRADHSFRLLHWFPAVMLLLWLGLEVAALEKGTLLRVVDWFTWGWTLPVVILAFVLLITYCFQVVRRRELRVSLLLLAFIPYVSMALLSARVFHWENELASVLWGGEWLASLEGGEFLGFRITERLPTEQNLNSSQDRSEENWREKLREAEERRQEIQEILARSGAIAVLPPTRVASGSNISVDDDRKPGNLPSSGPEDLGAFMLLLAAAYPFILHERARRRV